MTINNKKALLHDGQTLEIGGVRIECFLVPGHTWGHMVYLIDDKYLFTGDTLWFGADDAPLRAEIAEKDKITAYMEFTSFAFCDTIAADESEAGG